MTASFMDAARSVTAAGGVVSAVVPLVEPEPEPLELLELLLPVEPEPEPLEVALVEPEPEPLEVVELLELLDELELLLLDELELLLLDELEVVEPEPLELLAPVEPELELVEPEPEELDEPDPEPLVVWLVVPEVVELVWPVVLLVWPLLLLWPVEPLELLLALVPPQPTAKPPSAVNRGTTSRRRMFEPRERKFDALCPHSTASGSPKTPEMAKVKPAPPGSSLGLEKKRALARWRLSALSSSAPTPDV